MRLITIDDFIDVYSKLRQRGLLFILSKLNFQNIKRTISSFNTVDLSSSNWWIIPKVIERWNEKITGNPNVEYEEYFVKKYLNNSKNLTMLSLGSGDCSHELEFARYPSFKEIICVDISNNKLEEAKNIAINSGLNNIKFILKDVSKLEFPENYFDIVLFNHSLHHFKNINILLGKNIKNTLKDAGYIIINEYTGANRLQFGKKQIIAINESLNFINKKYRKKFKTNLYKNKIWGPGIIRMIFADPSESIESEKIKSELEKNFKMIEEKPFGGNILMYALKDISHHFVELDLEKNKILQKIFDFEDDYLLKNSSDFLFAIYQK